MKEGKGDAETVTGVRAETEVGVPAEATVPCVAELASELRQGKVDDDDDDDEILESARVSQAYLEAWTSIDDRDIAGDTGQTWSDGPLQVPDESLTGDGMTVPTFARGPAIRDSQLMRKWCASVEEQRGVNGGLVSGRLAVGR